MQVSGSAEESGPCPGKEQAKSAAETEERPTAAADADDRASPRSDLFFLSCYFRKRIDLWKMSDCLVVKASIFVEQTKCGWAAFGIIIIIIIVLRDQCEIVQWDCVTFELTKL